MLMYRIYCKAIVQCRKADGSESIMRESERVIDPSSSSLCQ